GLPEADRAGRSIGVLRSAVQRLDEEPARRASQRADSLEELIDELVRQLADEVALPVVTVLAVRRVEHALLVEEGMRQHAVVDQPGSGTQPAQLGRVFRDARVAGCEDERRCQRRVERDAGLAAETTRRRRAD